MDRDALVQTVAHNIQQVMAERGMNASSLAKAADVNPTGIYDIMSGKSRSPRLDTIGKIAKALHVPVSALFEEPGASGPNDQLLEVFSRLSEQERQRLLLAAEAWLNVEPRK